MKAVLERNLGFIGYPDYSVDTDGNVWALNYKCSKGKGETKQIKPAHDKKGYLMVSLNGYFVKEWKSCTEVDRVL